MFKVESKLGREKLGLETGELAKQANGSVKVTYGDTVLIVTSVVANEVNEDKDFFPLTVEYQERFYAAGRIPGGFFRREGKLSEREILSSRLIDRPLRPLFPEGFLNEVQIVATVVSVDDNLPDVLGIIGASASLYISDIPFTTPVGAVRIGRINQEFIINPTQQQKEESELDIIVAGTKDAVIMLEAGANQVDEKVILEAIDFAQPHIQQIIELQEELRKKAGKARMSFSPPVIEEEIARQVRELAINSIKEAVFIEDKLSRNEKINQTTTDTINRLISVFPDKEKQIRAVIETILTEIIRKSILKEGKRPDGRDLTTIRPIGCQVGVLPRTHGSALFSRGQTQGLVVTTLGTIDDEQMLDNIEGKKFKQFMLHYNFPPFSVGEIKPMRGPGRRETGHGALAERSLLSVIPPKEKFSYTIRVVSDILESNGSTSMASVCGGTLSLMDAGVPIVAPMAGISIGLIKEDDQFALLTDITGLEDGYGDMDFKVAGTKNGICGIQLDIKIAGISREIIAATFEAAKQARLYILAEMEKAIAEPKTEISEYAPKIVTITIPTDKIRDVIGQGGKVIKNIIATTGAKVNVVDDGTVTIAGPDKESTEQALDMIEYIIADAEVGKTYQGKVMRITSFGAFVEILPGKEGLVHISQLADYHVKNVEDVLSEGDEILVKVIGIDEHNRISLSKKAVSKT
ncbi:MAG: polyribonucleotide nucleotidyltransferase [bacterium]|nr:polyribonucleotide nucleotidyltransferase [bacterium]